MPCDIEAKYQELGGPGSFLGPPTDVQRQTPNGLGFYRHYRHGSIYCRDALPFGPCVVYGLIREKWAGMGWERSALGFPITDELPMGTAGGRVSFFEQGAVLYRPDVGTFETHGAIFRRWRDSGDVNGLGFPLTDELTTPDGRGRYNHFERGSIYWTPERGAWPIVGGVKDAWADSGWERGPVGYPITGSGRMPGTATDFQDFERGTIYAFGPNAKIVTLGARSIFATSEFFLQWSDFAGVLPDRDLITVTHTQGFPNFGATVTLVAGGAVNWWKAISLFSLSRGDFQEIFVNGQRRTASMRIAPTAFDGGSVFLHFKKAKAFGVHTGMYYLLRPDRLLGTNTTFTWIVD
jgi:hypothetical protein